MSLQCALLWQDHQFLNRCTCPIIYKCILISIVLLDQCVDIVQFYSIFFFPQFNICFRHFWKENVSYSLESPMSKFFPCYLLVQAQISLPLTPNLFFLFPTMHLLFTALKPFWKLLPELYNEYSLPQNWGWSKLWLTLESSGKPSMFVRYILLYCVLAEIQQQSSFILLPYTKALID